MGEKNLKTLRNSSLSSLIKFGVEKLGITPYEIGIIVANNVRGEESYNPNKYKDYEKYHQHLAFHLRDKIYSVLCEIERKGKDLVLKKQEKELIENLQKERTQYSPYSPLNLWKVIYGLFYKEVSNIPNFFRETMTNIKENDNFKNFFTKLGEILIEKVPQAITLKNSKGLENILTEEYKKCINKIVNVMHGFE